MELDTIRGLYVEELKDLYSAEQQILEALPKMIQKAANPDLRDGFSKHEAQTREHVARLETICAELGESASGKACEGMKGVLEDGETAIAAHANDEGLDMAMISAAQHVEHYEIAGYGTARSYARLLSLDSQAELLQLTLNEECETDKHLSDLAVATVTLEPAR